MLPFYFLFIVGGLIGLKSLSSRPEVRFEILTPPLAKIELFHFGFSDLIADSYWLQYIQEIGTCELTQKPNFREIQPRCQKGLSFQLLDAITKLAPRFRMPQAVGGIALSLINYDYSGAQIIFDRAIENFPNDWPILYRAGYHYHFDQQDLVKAAELYRRAAALGAPPWLNELSSKLQDKAGNRKIAIAILEDYLKDQQDEKTIARIQEKIEALKKEQ